MGHPAAIFAPRKLRLEQKLSKKLSLKWPYNASISDKMAVKKYLHDKMDMINGQKTSDTAAKLTDRRCNGSIRNEKIFSFPSLNRNFVLSLQKLKAKSFNED